MYAIIESGGKQYQVTPGQTVDVDYMGADAGSSVEIDRVMLVADGDKVTVGNPVVDGARVLATVKENGRGDKVIVFKYKPKVRYRRKIGHRQQFTRLNIDRIAMPGEEKAEAKPVKRTRRKKEVTADGS